MNAIPKIRLLLRTIFMLQSVTMAASAQTSDSAGKLWPEFDFYIKLNENMRIYALYSATNRENLGNAAEGQTGVHIDFHAVPAFRKRLVSNIDQSRSKMLMVRAGYLISSPKNNSVTSIEHMATAEATARAHLQAGWLLSERNRLDFRWVGGDPKHRYRNRPKIEKTFDIGKFQLTPYAHAEVFDDLKLHDWTRFRYLAGAEWNIAKLLVLKGYYLRQNAWASVPQFVNAAGMAGQFYFR